QDARPAFSKKEYRISLPKASRMPLEPWDFWKTLRLPLQEPSRLQLGRLADDRSPQRIQHWQAVAVPTKFCSKISQNLLHSASPAGIRFSPNLISNQE